MASKKEQITFTRLCAVSRDLIYLATTPDDQELGTPFTAICQYNAGEWSYETFDISLSSMTLFKAPDKDYRVLYLLDENGVAINFDTKEREVILSDRSPLWKDYRLGYLQKIRQIGAHLYACGDGGQVYRREHDATWQFVDKAFLDGPDALLNPKSELRLLSRLMNQGENLTPENLARAKQLREANASNLLWDFSGLSEDSIYFASEKKQVYWFDGKTIHALPDKTDRGLISILAKSEDVVYAAGRDGTFLVGNHKSSFREIDAFRGLPGWPNINGMALFQDRLYMSSFADPRGLLVLNGDQIEQVHCDLTPDIKDVSAVAAVTDALWVMGTKDLLRFDGSTWERIHFPANDPVR
ncbi:hypothetical protein [Oryzifoliimicrobium ureilyticus]|uniref:hypothetical protein n=1 Tax=Oryzifoliimicrobium ureilyticus TaxID=3113724 RepID=UPI00307600AC